MSGQEVVDASRRGAVDDGTALRQSTGRGRGHGGRQGLSLRRSQLAPIEAVGSDGLRVLEEPRGSATCFFALRADGSGLQVDGVGAGRQPLEAVSMLGVDELLQGER